MIIKTKCYRAYAEICLNGANNKRFFGLRKYFGLPLTLEQSIVFNSKNLTSTTSPKKIFRALIRYMRTEEKTRENLKKKKNAPPKLKAIFLD